MSKRTLILIIFLTVLTAFFVYLAVSQNSLPQPTQNTQTNVIPTTKPSQAFTTLALQSQTPTLVAVTIDTHGKKNKVTAVQLELSYDPQKVSGVTVTPGKFIGTTTPLINRIDEKQGRITYALAIQPSGKGVTGSGTVATISFQPRGTGTMELKVLPTTLVTAEGVSESVLRQATGTTITLSSAPLQSTPAAVQR
jgi:hypothetical protein